MRLMGELSAEQTGGEQRRTDRRVLALAVPASVAAPGQPVIIRNLSRTGMLVETTAHLPVGEALHIDLPEAGRVGAKVVWQEGVLHGCAFAAPISQAAVSAAQLLAPHGADPADMLPDDRWPAPLRLLAIVGATVLLWGGLIVAGVALTLG